MDKTILIVEDDKLLGSTMKTTFEQAGFHIIWAKDAQEVYSLLSEKIDLIFLDIVLPGEESGYDILRNIKNNEKLRNIPVIMLTNMGQTNDIERGLDVGATDYAIKANMDLAQLIALAKKYLMIYN